MTRRIPSGSCIDGDRVQLNTNPLYKCPAAQRYKWRSLDEDKSKLGRLQRYYRRLPKPKQLKALQGEIRLTDWLICWVFHSQLNQSDWWKKNKQEQTERQSKFSPNLINRFPLSLHSLPQYSSSENFLLGSLYGPYYAPTLLVNIIESVGVA